MEKQHEEKKKNEELKTKEEMEKQAALKLAKQKKRKTAAIVAAVILAAVVLVAVVVVGMNKEEKEPEPVKETEAPVIYGDEKLGIDPEVDKQLKNYRNVVLFGIDAKNIENEKGHRSDAIIILSMNKKTNEIKMFSVYRDTYLKIDEEHGLDKVNHAYAYGGMDQSIKALNQNLDLNIREGMALTWEAVKNLVDDLNGVDVEIEAAELSTLNGALSSENQISAAGLHTLNGDQAVAYCRIRYDSSDYRRNERMKIVLEAAMNKAKTLPTGKAVDIMDRTLGEVTTNMSRNKMTDTLMNLASYDVTTSLGWPYTKTGWMNNSIWYAIPRTLETNVSRLHAEFFAQEGYVPTEFVKSVSLDIQNTTGYGAE